MYSSRSIALHRAAVTTIVLAAFVVTFVQARALWTLTDGIPFGRSVRLGSFAVPGGEFIDYYSTFVFSAFGGLLALFFSWKLPQRTDARVAALAMAFFAPFLSLFVVPSGSLTFVHRATFSISYACALVLFLRFTMVFPRTLSLADLAALGGGGAQPSRRQRLGQVIRSAQGFTLSHPALLWWLGALLVGLTYVTTSAAFPYFLGDIILSHPLAWVAFLLWFPFHFAVSALAVSFLWTGYRLANAEERSKTLWIVLGVSFGVAWFGFVMSLLYAALLTDIQILWTIVNPMANVLFSVMWFSILAGFAMAIFSSGAFDVRPLIDKTALYGLLGIVLLFLFGGVEVALGDFVLAWAGAPTGASTWIAGGTVAIVFGPLRTTFKKRVDHWLHDTLPATLLAEGPRVQSVIVFSDIVGFTKLASEDEDDALTMLSVFHRVARKAATKRNGALVKTMGDGVLMEFKETPDAVGAVEALSSSFAAALAPLDLPEGRLRTGIHFGLVARRRDGDLFGDAVNPSLPTYVRHGTLKELE